MTHTPHDALFKFIFGRPEHAAAELRAVLPDHLTSAIRWSSLTLASSIYVDPTLAERRDARHPDVFLRSLDHWIADLDAVLAAPTGRDAAIRLLRYVVLVLDAVRLGQLHDKLRMLSPATGALTMTTIAEQWLAEGEAKGKAKGKAEGRAEGRAEALLLVLDARGFHLSDEARARIRSTTDVEQLERWLRRGATVASPDELFDG